MIDVTAPGRKLHRRFVALGDMGGKTFDEIAAAVGPRTSISSMAGGRTLVQWQATGCHMALMFGPDGRFAGITHQFAHYQPAPPGCLILLGSLVALLTIIATVLVCLS